MDTRPPGQLLLTVEAAATQLQLHPKTVLRCIRDGRLKATRIGKAYRIRRADVEAFAGLPAREAPPAEAWVTAIVDVPDADPETARACAIWVPAALKGRRDSHAPMRADVIYEPERFHLKVVLVGSPGDTADILGAITIWLEQRPEARS